MYKNFLVQYYYIVINIFIIVIYKYLYAYIHRINEVTGSSSTRIPIEPTGIFLYVYSV
jgi:hypothetical protein